MTKAIRLADFFPARLASPDVEVSVVMVVYKTGPDLFTSIDHVLAEPRVDDFVIVDNGSTPEDAAHLRALADREPRIRLLHGHGNIGFARGANLGASQAAGRWLVFLNPDAFLQPGCIESLVKAASGAPSPAVIGACVLNPDGTEQRGARRGEVTPFTTLMSFTHMAESRRLRQFEIHREFEPLPEAPVATPTISGACFCVSREDFQALNGFDGRFFLHVEDVDLCWRARQMGGQVLFQPHAKVIHVGHTSLAEPEKVEFHKGQGLARYFRKRADTPMRKLLAWVLGPLIVAAAVSRPTLRRMTGGPIRRL